MVCGTGGEGSPKPGIGRNQRVVDPAQRPECSSSPGFPRPVVEGRTRNDDDNRTYEDGCVVDARRMAGSSANRQALGHNRVGGGSIRADRFATLSATTVCL